MHLNNVSVFRVACGKIFKLEIKMFDTLTYQSSFVFKTNMAE